MHRFAFSIDGDSDRHILDFKLINRFHSKLRKGHNFSMGNRFGHQISRATHGNQINRFIVANRIYTDLTALSFTDHAHQSSFLEHGPSELVHTCRGGRSGRANRFVTHWINWTHVIDKAIS